MRIAVDGIPAPGRVVDVALSTTWARQAAERALEAPALRLGGQITVHAPEALRRVRVEVRVNAAAVRACDRCGEDTELDVVAEGSLTYHPEEQGPKAEEVRLSEEEMDVGWYAEGQIDVADVLSEALALALPSRVTCVDAAACDARTAALLAAARDPDMSPFAALRRTH
jgi:uncharacterized metal-binding protein YceD (DUF177 family)